MSQKETILDFEKNDGIAISDLFNIFKNNFKLFSIITSLITLLSVIYSLMLTPIFQAEVVAIPAEKTTSSGGSLVSGVTGMARLAGISLPSGSSDDIQTSIAIAESKKFNMLFVNQENLLPVLFKEDWNEETQSWNNEEIPTDIAGQSELRSHYSIGYSKTDGIITFTMRWDDPKLAAEYANKFVSSVNDYIRDDEISEAQKSINYLKEEIKNTTLVDIKSVLNSLVQDQLQTIMLANVREDYVFKVIDPAMTPKTKIKPKRRQIVFMGFIFGIIIASLCIFIRENSNSIISGFK